MSPSSQNPFKTIKINKDAKKFKVLQLHKLAINQPYSLLLRKSSNVDLVLTYLFHFL